MQYCKQALYQNSRNNITPPVTKCKHLTFDAEKIALLHIQYLPNSKIDSLVNLSQTASPLVAQMFYSVYYTPVFVLGMLPKLFKNVRYIPDIYWSKVLTDQPGRCQFFRKYKIVKNLKRATIKQVIIQLSKLLKFIFRKSHYVTFLHKTLNVPYRNTRLQFYHCYLSSVLDIQNHTFFHRFEWKKVLIC